MYVLDCITYFSPQFLLIEFHLEEQKQMRSYYSNFLNKQENITCPNITGRQASSNGKRVISNCAKKVEIF